MRAFSSARHLVHIRGAHDRHVSIDDPLLPAAAHLTGNSAVDVLRPVVAATGGELIDCRPSHVQYRPESDLVVRYRCRIRRGRSESSDTVLAATTITGPPAGTVPVEAHTAAGTALAVGVWRWPFDPVLADLATMVTPHLAAAHLLPIVGSRFELEVVAYRPTERAVIRVRGEHREIYVKVVPPATTAALIARHATLGEAGLPVPRMLAAGDGWFAMEALVGTTLRDRLKQGAGRLPPPQRYGELLDALAAIDLPMAAPARSRLDDARHHAAMLATVLPDARNRLDEIVERLSVTSSSDRARGTVHGDLHEAQMVVDDHRVTGLLDIDDVGPGDPLDDVGTLVAHLAFRAMTSGDQRTRRYGQSVRSALAGAHDVADLDRHVAAVLVGLATGPFRVQQPDWAPMTLRVLDLVEDHLAASGATAVAATR